MATDLTLTKAQRNSVFQEFLRLKFDPRGLEWITERSREAFTDVKVSVLRLPTLDYYFRFDKVRWSWTPSDKGRAVEYFAHGGDWERLSACLRRWLRVLKPEVEEPDLWEVAKQDRLISQAATSSETQNQLFTPTERKLISEQLMSVQTAMSRAHNLSADQRAALDAGFSYLIESSKRLGRKDWMNIAIGAVVNIAVGATFAPDASRHLLHLVTAGLQTLFSAAIRLVE